MLTLLNAGTRYTLPADVQTEVVKTLMQLLKAFSRGATFVLNRICQTVARVFVNSYPDQWTNFFADMMPLAKNQLTADDSQPINTQLTWLQLIKVRLWQIL
jgi:hypothetical protein